MANRIETGLKIKGLTGDTYALEVIGDVFFTGNTYLSNIVSPTMTGLTYIDFDLTQTATTSTPGRLFWDDDNKTLSIGMGVSGVTQQIGQEQYYLVENQTGGVLNNGTVVRASGTTGSSGKITIDYMIANGTIPAFTTLGVLTETVNNGETSLVTSFGLVRDINTTGSLYSESWSQGDILYVSPTVLGGFTNVKPYTPNQDIIIAIVVEVGVSGSIFVRPDVYRPFKDPQLITVAKQNGDFTSIKEAVDHIFDSSTSKRYVINVGPGEFNEGEIDLTTKPYVSIVGSSIQTTLITPSGSTHIFKMGQTNEISFLSLSGAVVPYAGIYCYDIGSFAQAHKISIYNCDTGILVESNTQDTIFYGEYIDINGDFTYGVKSVGNNGYLALANMENFYVFPTGISSTGGYTKGSGASINISSALFEGTDLSGQTATLSEDGGKFNISSTDVTNWGYGYKSLNIGVGSIFEFNGVTFADNIWDINVEQTTTTGSFLGISNHEKITTISENVFWSFLDSNDGELDITRKGSVTFTDGSHTDFTTLIFEGGPMGLIQGGQITVVSALTINTATGYGYLEKSDNIGIVRRIDWNDRTLDLSPDSDLYVYVTENGTLSSSASRPSSVFNIILGRVVTNLTTIEFIDLSPVNAEHMANRYGSLFRNALGPIYSTGSIVTENTSIPLHLDVSQGEYYYASNEFMPSGGTDITFTQYYRNGLGGWITSATTIVDNTSYDGNGSLSALTLSSYTKHTLYLVGQGSYEKYFLVLGQNEYPTLVQAENALLPTPPTFFSDSVTQIANIYVQQGVTGITQIEDIRPVIGFKAGGVNASSVHGNLLGLTADDHLQYLRVDGVRPMSSALNMGTFNITNAGTINGVTIQSHALRHKFNGGDEVGTVTPSANAIPYADVNSKLDSWISTATTSTLGLVKLSTSPVLPSNPIAIGENDTRFANSFTGASYIDNRITFSKVDGSTTGVTLNSFTGLSINGNLTVTGNTVLEGLTASTISATSVSATTLYGSGTNLTGVVNSITASSGISASTSTGLVTLINTSPDQLVTISGGTGITTGGTYPNFTITNSSPDQIVTIAGAGSINVSGTYPNFTISSTGGGGGGSSRITGSTTTSTLENKTLSQITTLSNDSTHFIESFVTAKSSGDTAWGTWKRTLSVTTSGTTPTIRFTNADMDYYSSNLSATTVNFAVSGSNININVSGITSTEIQWNSAYEIIVKSTKI